MRLASDSKLAYYPTYERETRRLLSVLGEVYLSSYRTEKVKQFIGEDKFRSIYTNAYDASNHDAALFDACFDVEKGAEFLNTSGAFQFGWNFSYSNGECVVLDGFAGKGEWASTFNLLKAGQTDTRKFTIVTNEIEDGRYKKAKLVSDHAYHGAFEDMQLPKNSVGIMLFNPPYGSDGEIRNAKKYLDMSLEYDLFVKPNKDDWRKAKPVFISVLNSADTMYCLPTIIKNFDIKLLYRVEDDVEFQKFNQFIIVALKRDEVWPDSYGDLIQTEYQRWSKLVMQENRFRPDYYNIFRKDRPYLPMTDFKTLLENFKFWKDEKKYVSHPNSTAMAWAKNMTKVYIGEGSKIVMPKTPKHSEVTNLISAGTINGELSLPGGNAKHVAVGGVKMEMVTTEERETNDDGEMLTVIKTIIQSTPYLNVLHADSSGKLIIKELSS
jgi:hypothetical protein